MINVMKEQAMSSTKYLDGTTLRDDGYLQEVNRLFFHPLGLALALLYDDAFDTAAPMTDQARLRVVDYRDYPKGVVFVYGDLTQKAKRIETISQSRRDCRVNAPSITFCVLRKRGQTS
jgi:hypothetical protein